MGRTGEASPSAQAKSLILTFCLAALAFRPAALAQAPDPGPASRMKAIVYHTYGGPEVLRLEEIEKPIPGDDQLLVRVRAASVNPLDWHFVRGTPYFGRLGMGLLAPEVTRVGVDFAGTVEAVGRNVTRFKPGDEVFGGRKGAFAEYVTIRQDRAVASKPANVTFDEAASVPVAGVTALQGLRDKGGIRPGQKVLINGASGGVGTFAVQIAKAFGAEVTGVCSTRNVELVRSIGADHVVDYTREDFTKSGRRYDLVFDTIGNHSFLECRRALEPRGVYVIVGGPSGRWIAPLDSAARALLVSRFVSQKAVMFLAELNEQDLVTLGDLMRSGKVKPVVDRRYPLSDAAAAVGYLERGHARGKVVITVGRDGDTSPARVDAGGTSESTTGSDVLVLALVAAVVVVPVVAALALNRRHRRRNPGKRPYRWGYYVSIMSFVGGVCLGLFLDAGAAAAIACGAIYAALAWSFARRRHWAWIALTVLTFNPVAWIVNLLYLRKRWAEDAVAA
jgi:NADPH:quinone reductase-like Zn-dependent oxidoreductase